MTRRFAFAGGVTAVLLLGGGAPAAAPRALSKVEPGAWEISRSATGDNPRAICLRQMIDLAAIAHPGERCHRTIIRNAESELIVELTCPRGDFARSEIRVTTPRSLKLETQGVHGGQPFRYTFYARRRGACQDLR